MGDLGGGFSPGPIDIPAADPIQALYQPVAFKTGPSCASEAPPTGGDLRPAWTWPSARA